MKIFSGIQPTNQLHIGNYLGAIAQWIDLQKDNECIFWIADLHALTVPYQAKKLQKRTLEVVATYLATGIDPEKSIIFRQSDVKEHSELAWLLSTITPVGDLERMTQFKDKSQKHKANINAGLLNYPVLMAADILLYQSNRVPVGIDQKQHIELARTIAKKFNKKFGETFIVPEGLYSKLGAKIMSLKEPTKKMSKSDSPDSFISLFDSPEQIKKKIASATTDSLKSVKYNPEKQPGIANLLTIYSLFAEQLIKEIEKEFANKGYAEFKQGLALLLIKKLKPFRDKKEEIAKNPELLKDILENGAKKARLIAQLTMQKVKQAMGLV
ncbi:tryptophan--tRNA ligase [bacterium (Candidatus Gribaldobacteria) CG23_combo_of_CG06-09_8_20_14_all_37_87_8]|uniref:Tryptophan--tRNA ligase n=1 Tax=bacterium (Candidatus Gribaldobacteria) CG23_combo_of_CG06-09_8_20_14_all_37_87_8 TaxID=2014278 RepID=A0A2G9ZFD1_9BACT|nr:MAG: tryptophan--tRNA ligase [bacterium (Candidatus Gribaldobacteria) CG23_combo_of_CG06-09_8_20_14_all_37_87_8]